MVEFSIGAAIGARAGWVVRARMNPGIAATTPATDAQRAYLEDLLNSVPRGDVSLEDETIVFSGFRDDTLRKQIEKAGGAVEERLTKSRTTRLLTWNSNGAPTTKVKAAQRHGIAIEHRADFARRFYQ